MSIEMIVSIIGILVSAVGTIITILSIRKTADSFRRSIKIETNTYVEKLESLAPTINLINFRWNSIVQYTIVNNGNLDEEIASITVMTSKKIYCNGIKTNSFMVLNFGLLRKSTSFPFKLGVNSSYSDKFGIKEFLAQIPELKQKHKIKIFIKAQTSSGDVYYSNKISVKRLINSIECEEIFNKNEKKIC